MQTTEVFLESLIIPAEKDINTKQEQISGERFPDNVLELCDKCHRCYRCFNIKGLVDPCPLCGTQGSHIPDIG
jgi:rRNA maturation endonuclease Nob1